MRSVSGIPYEWVASVAEIVIDDVDVDIDIYGYDRKLVGGHLIHPSAMILVTT